MEFKSASPDHGLIKLVYFSTHYNQFSQASIIYRYTRYGMWYMVVDIVYPAVYIHIYFFRYDV